MIYLFYASLLAAVITKVCDCYTTVKYLEPATEGNPLGRRLMQRYGMSAGTWSLFGIVIVALGVMWGIVALFDKTWVTVMCTIYATLIALLQGAAAHTNATLKLNFVTRPLLRIFHAWSKRWDERELEHDIAEQGGDSCRQEG